MALTEQTSLLVMVFESVNVPCCFIKFTEMGENSRKYIYKRRAVALITYLSCVMGHLNDFGPRVCCIKCILHARSNYHHEVFMNGTGHARMCDLLPQTVDLYEMFRLSVCCLTIGGHFIIAK
jgi:hypothetical protein